MSLLKSFGKFPDRKRKSFFNTLSNYKDGQFQNPVPTGTFAEGENILKALWQFIKRHPDTEPKQTLPFVQTDIKNIPLTEDVLIWFGHSSYYLQTDWLRFLVDPVFSGNASPIAGSVKAFPGSNTYSANDFPEIDVLFLSHDHWDHLDYSTIQQLQTKVKKVICGLGVAQHFEFWGWDQTKLIEKNWYESYEIRNGIEVTLTPARHFSGRGFKRNISLWTSFVLQTPSRKIFLGGDSGYSPHFKEVGERFGPFDLAILECGQYNRKWPFIHSFPDELVQEAKELKAATVLPVHHSKFKLAHHPWYEPLEQTVRIAEKENKPLITPRIGEVVSLNNFETTTQKWWRECW